LATLARPADADAAANGIEAWRAACAESGFDDPATETLLAAVFGNSPYLGGCLLREPGFARAVLSRGPAAVLDELLAELDTATASFADDAETGRVLRRAKRRAALLIGLADIAGSWTTERVCAALSQFAECAVGLAVASLLRGAVADGELNARDEADVQTGSGFVVLAMGKLGGGELNYSSDIDLLVLFDEDRATYRGRRSIGDFFVRLTRRLVMLLDERTVDGYVFRTDLRLRPDPGATPLALSVFAAETYYESLGQNWERAAMIKARPVAGDRAAGEAFLRVIRPFVWRQNLDFATIQDIHSIKRQIQAHRGGGGEIVVPGHNIKLGRGGIREIEFFAQTQQLIWGGRYHDLRARPTCAALAGLRDHKRISAEVEAEMVAAYWFLRRVENRLQMIDDRQVHSLPDTAEGLDRFAAFLGYETGDAFVADITAHLRRVADHYSRLFENSPALAAPTEDGGNLVFTGIEDDPETLRTLMGLGFERPEVVSELIRAWHHGRLRATRSTRSRQILTGLMPVLVSAFGRTANPDAAFLKFNEFLGNLPAGIQLFSLFQAYPKLLDLVAEIMGTAPRLAAYLSRHARLLDAVLTVGFFEPLPERAILERTLAGELETAGDFQDALDVARRWSGDAKFQVSMQQMRGLIDAEAAGRALTDVADLLVGAMLDAVEADFARRYGRIPGAALAVLGYGKLGGRALCRGSDLDLVFVYQIPAPDAVSDGERALSASAYFTRLGQRLITAISAQTGEGQLYEVDMRLRPMGDDGPIASEVSGVERYYTRDAWTWELMALTRARVVRAPQGLKERLEALFKDALARPRDAGQLVADIAAMRRRVAAEHGTDDPWAIKFVRGGLFDVEFIAQYLQLRDAATHPDVLDTNTIQALEKLTAADRLDQAQADHLIAAARLYHNLQAVTRLGLSERFDEDTLPDGLRQVLVKAGGAVDFAALNTKLLDAQGRTRALFDALIERPAAAHARLHPNEDESTRHGEDT
jgi:glutamate-ammonia-ligase adenylyltransferase